MSGPDIFISYNRQERTAARLFAESFEKEGFSVWWDAVLHSGETFDEVIERQLRAAKAVVVLWSPRSVTSRWVRAEATQADRANKLVPVMIEPCTLPIIFELTHTADLSDWKGERSDAVWHSLVSDLRRHIGPPKEEIPVQAAPAKQPETQQPAAPVGAPPIEAKPEAPAPSPPVEAKEEVPAPAPPVEAKPDAPAPSPPVEAQAEARAPEPEKQDEKAKANGKALKASQEDLAQALEKFSKAHGSVLLEPTHAEESQTKFFKQSDEFRQAEGPVHCLRRVHAPDGEAPYVVGPAGLKIGRTAPADIVAAEPSVSRQHCVVEFAADKLRVTDLNSTNGTYIDNKRVEGSQILPVGSVLRVGNVSFEHEVHDRADFEQQKGALGFNLGPNDREPRTARSS